MNFIAKYWHRMVALGILAGIVWALNLFPTWTLPSTSVGPRQFPRYALNPQSNPVVDQHSTFSAHWTFTASMPLRMSSIAQGTVYTVGMGQNWLGRDVGMLYALGAARGRVLWQHPLDNWSMTAPVVAHGMVFVGSGNEAFSPSNAKRDIRLSARHVVRGTGPNSIYGFDARTGRLLWKVPTKGENMPTFVYRQGQLFVANGAGEVLDLTARTGRVLWKQDIGSYVSMSSPVLVGNRLLVVGAHPYRLYAINAQSGKMLWSSSLPGAMAGADDCSLAVSSHTVYLLGTIGTWQHASSRLYAYSLSGHLVWSYTTGNAPLPQRIEVGAPTVYGQTVYFSSPLSRTIYAMNTNTGKVRWAARLPVMVKTSVAVRGSVIVVPTVKNVVLALDRRTGRIVHRRTLKGKFISFPIVVGHTVYLTSNLGTLYAVPLSWLTG